MRGLVALSPECKVLALGEADLLARYAFCPERCSAVSRFVGSAAETLLKNKWVVLGIPAPRPNNRNLLNNTYRLTEGINLRLSG